MSDAPDDDDADAVPSRLRYTQRPRQIGFEIAFDLDLAATPPTLTVDRFRRKNVIAVTDVESVRFWFRPGNLSTTGYRTTLRLKDGRSVTFGNISFRSMVEIERKDRDYVRFTTALTRAIAAANPSATFHAGRPRWIWTALVAITALTLGVIGWMAARALADGNTTLLALAALVLALTLWQMGAQIRLNRPRALRAGQLPQDLLPGA